MFIQYILSLVVFYTYIEKHLVQTILFQTIFKIINNVTMLTKFPLYLVKILRLAIAQNTFHHHKQLKEDNSNDNTNTSLHYENQTNIN